MTLSGGQAARIELRNRLTSSLNRLNETAIAVLVRTNTVARLNQVSSSDIPRLSTHRERIACK
jgi:hypothetical protein